ncbi:hypothetical protein AGMMS50229_05120 [Campylobacterota bacterium]|nr:hypothetical protein AGMMS50229_05120 [Campylobacterota bacterium]
MKKGAFRILYNELESDLKEQFVAYVQKLLPELKFDAFIHDRSLFK